MRARNLIGATALVAGVLMTIDSAAAYDESKYPDFNGQWRRAGSVRSDRIGAAFERLGSDDHPRRGHPGILLSEAPPTGPE